MATPTVAPHTQPIPDDLVTLETASALLEPTPEPASATKIGKWVRFYRIRVYRPSSGRAYRVSFTDVVRAQRDEAVRLGRVHLDA